MTKLLVFVFLYQITMGYENCQDQPFINQKREAFINISNITKDCQTSTLKNIASRSGLIETLWIYNGDLNLTNLVLPSASKLFMMNLTLEICQLELKNYEHVTLSNVSIRQRADCKDKGIMISSSFKIEMNDTRFNNFQLKGTSKNPDDCLLLLSSITLSLLKISFSHNTLYNANLLDINCTKIFITDLKFTNNLILCAIMFRIDPGMIKFNHLSVANKSGIQYEAIIVFENNSMVSSQFMVILESLSAAHLTLYFARFSTITFHNNQIQTIFDHPELFEQFLQTNQYLYIQPNYLIDISWSRPIIFENILFVDNTIKWQFQVVIFHSVSSGIDIGNLQFIKNTFLSFQMTILHSELDYHANISGFLFDKTNNRDQEKIRDDVVQVLATIQTYKLIEMSKKNGTIDSTYDKILDDTCSYLESFYYQQFPVYGIVCEECFILEVRNFIVEQNCGLNFQAVQTENYKRVISITINTFRLQRQPQKCRITIFDLCQFSVKGVFQVFFLQDIWLVNLQIAKQNLISVTSVTSISASNYICIKKIFISNCSIYILDNSNQISFILISHDREQPIKISRVTVNFLRSYSHPFFYTDFSQLLKKDPGQSLSKLCLKGNISNTRFGIEAQSLQPQTTFLTINSIYSIVELSDCRFSNITLSFNEYFLSIISQSLNMTQIQFDGIQQTKQNLEKQFLIAFFGDWLLIHTLHINNFSSQTGQILFVQFIGNDTIFICSRSTLSNIETTSSDEFSIVVQGGRSNQTGIILQSFICNGIENRLGLGILHITAISYNVFQILVSQVNVRKLEIKEEGFIFNFSLPSLKNSSIRISQLSMVNTFQSTSYSSVLRIRNFRDVLIDRLSLQHGSVNQLFKIQDSKQLIIDRLNVTDQILGSLLPLIIITKTQTTILTELKFSMLTLNKSELIHISGDNQQCIVTMSNFRMWDSNSSSNISRLLVCQNLILRVSDLQMQNLKNILLLDMKRSKMIMGRALLNHIELEESAQCTALTFNLSNVSIENSTLQNFKGGYYGGVILFTDTDTKLIYGTHNTLRFGQQVKIQNVIGKFGAIYHRSISSPHDFKLIEWQHFTDLPASGLEEIVGIPDAIQLVVASQENSEKRIIWSFRIKQSQSVHIFNIRNGSKLTLNLQQIERTLTHREQLKLNYSWNLISNEYQYQPNTSTYELPEIVTSGIKDLELIELNFFHTLMRFNRLTNTNLFIYLHYRQCIPGEILKQLICELCPNNMYSLQMNSEKCLDCQAQSICQGGRLTGLKPYYWRHSKDVDVFEYCNNKPIACEDSKPNRCIEGYNGPKCEACDMEGSYSVHTFMRASQRRCEKCVMSTNAQLTYAFIGFLTLLCIHIQLNMTYGSNLLQCIVMYIRRLGLLNLGTSGLFNASVYIKTIIFHYQMLQMFQAFQMDGIVSSFIDNSNSISNPTKMLAFTTDCITSPTNISVAYVDVFVALAYIMFLITIGWLFSLVNILGKAFKPKYTKFVLLYSFWSQVPQLTYFIGAALSCKRILGQYYVRGDVTQTCMSASHRLYLESFLIPILLIIFLAGTYLGVYLYIQHKGCNYLLTIDMQTLFGMLYKEYRYQFCSFEVTKLYLKILIVLIINFLEDFPVFMTLIINMILLLYYLALQQYKPYTFYRAQHLDQLETLIFMFTIQLILSLGFTEIVTVQILLKIILVSANVYFTLYVFFHLFYRYLTLIKPFISYLGHLNPRLIALLGKVRSNNLTVFYNWKILQTRVRMQKQQNEVRYTDTLPQRQVDLKLILEQAGNVQNLQDNPLDQDCFYELY